MQVWGHTKLCEIMLLYNETRKTYTSCSTFLKPTKHDIQRLYGLFKLLSGFGKFGDQPTKLDKHCFCGLLKLLQCFGKIGDPPNFVKSRFYTKKLVIPITFVLHS